MTLWNTAVPVIDLIEASTAEAAIAKLGSRLRRAGFEIFEGPLENGANAFESEEGYES